MRIKPYVIYMIFEYIIKIVIWNFYIINYNISSNYIKKRTWKSITGKKF